MTPGVLVVRQRGVVPLRQELMVLRGAETHGLNARRDVSERRRITPVLAYRLLDQLATRGLMAREGRTGQSAGHRRTLK